MCRFFFLLLLVILGFLLIASFFGFSALFWPIIIGLVGSSFGLLFLPKRGDQFAYRNWYRWMAVKMLLGYSAIFILFFAFLILGNIGSDKFTTAFLIFFAVLMGGTYALGWQIGPTTRRRRWLKRRYPKAFSSINFYKKRSEVLENYTPCLIIEDSRYFLIEYYGRGLRDNSRSLFLIGEAGNPIRDEILFQKAVQCKTLGINTIDYARFNGYAQAITNAQEAYAGLKEVIDILREEEENILRYSKESALDFKKIYIAEEPIRLFTDATIGIQLLEAKWSKEHGLSKLTAVDYGEVKQLIKAIELEREESVAHYSTITAAAKPAERLVNVIDEIPYLVRFKSKVVEGLLGISDMGKMLVGHEVFEYAPPTDADWQAWRDGLAWADQVDAGVEG